MDYKSYIQDAVKKSRTRRVIKDYISYDMVSDNKLLLDAVEYACDAHGGNVRKGTDIPYIVHPLEVGRLTWDTLIEYKKILGGREMEAIAAAILHDTVEDTKTTKQDIMEKFGENICFLVACETEDKRENLPASDTWKIRKQEFLAELCEAPVYAKIISMCDKVSNLRDTAADYKKIGDKVFERFNQKDKSEHKWYYEEILNRLEEFRELSIYKEFATLCKKVFG